ncbi:MAG TPA: DUF4249 family protein [Saprospiraceae bacterium]|nr:DUF4249 domain-containing protein [Saprospiraceae bacterium]HRO09231.1 DUF4249 family protein [Saprospiraceae bacterium]HRP42593.1 DUF4249 family protein [Saprospiraceae bacterium]
MIRILKRGWTVSMIIYFGMAILLNACETPFVPDDPDFTPQIVVEGYVETGTESLPAYVILTRTIPFSASVNEQIFGDLFVNDAEVTVFDGTNTVRLTEVCLQDLTPEVKQKVGDIIGINADSIDNNICLYIDIFDQLKRETGRKYDLTVHADNQIITASTSLPEAVELSDFKWVEPSGQPIDSMAELRVIVKDPVNEKNYYRYLTATDKDRQFIPPPFGSVVDDAVFNGQEFEIPLARAQRRTKDLNPDTFGLYMRGDSAYIKWCTIDKAHFDFWNTRDFAAGNSGSFSSYTRVTSNIHGGIGIWGGYTVRLYRLYCPPK